MTSRLLGQALSVGARSGAWRRAAKRIAESAFVAFALLVTAVDAAANGRYPGAGLVVFDSGDVNRLAVRTTFGVLVSRDRGASFEYVCESALRLGVEEDPMLAFGASGRLVVATVGGMLTSDDACSYALVESLAEGAILDLARSETHPDRFVALRLTARTGGLSDTSVVRSHDSGATWEVLPPLAEGLLPVTVDIAAPESSRVYLTARRGAGDDYDSVLLVSDDGGETFAERAIPNTSGQRLAYIAAVHPRDAERLALRVNAADETVLYETRDAGTTFDTLHVASGRLTGFAYSPNGERIAFGGPDEGLFEGASESRAFERRSHVAPTCLGWNDDGLWACADARSAGFSLGRSRDGGKTFERVLAYADLCGTSSCDGESDVGARCADDWQSVAQSLGATCMADGGSPGGRTDAGAPQKESKPGRDVGCGIAAGPSNSSRGIVALSVWCTLFVARRRELASRRTFHRVRLSV
ncbi:MAG TPA: hypothetical protein VFZ53_19590 [Polyangiaceae bacterium]